jgi:hypothetical protein
MSGAKSRRKGANWEREVANILTELTGVECSRRLQQYQVGGSDIETILPIAVEAKTGYRISVTKALDQVEDAAGEEDLPFVWVKQNRKGNPPSRYIVMKEEYFLPLLRSYLKGWGIRLVEMNKFFDDSDIN